MSFQIRLYHSSDLPCLYRICLQTAIDGADGTALFVDPDLMGHYFVGPYAVLEPAFCFVLLHHNQPAGYICATRDFQFFRQQCEERWFPTLRQRYPVAPASATAAERELYTLIQEGIDLNHDVNRYPARLHIALLPAVQRQGGGRQLINALFLQLQSHQVPAVHLEVSIHNYRAIAFYEAMGFHRVAEYPGAIMFGYHLV